MLLFMHVEIPGIWVIEMIRLTIVITNNRINIYIYNLCRINLLSCGVLMSVGYYRHNNIIVEDLNRFWCFPNNYYVLALIINIIINDISYFYALYSLIM